MKKSTNYLLAGILALAILWRSKQAPLAAGDVNEWGFAVYERDGQFFRGPESWGTRHGLTIPVDAPAGFRPMALFHTHPPEAPEYPSDLDIASARQYGIPSVCIGHRGVVRCYPV